MVWDVRLSIYLSIYRITVRKNQIVKLIKESLFRWGQGIFCMCKEIRMIGKTSNDTDILFILKSSHI